MERYLFFPIFFAAIFSDRSPMTQPTLPVSIPALFTYAKAGKHFWVFIPAYRKKKFSQVFFFFLGHFAHCFHHVNKAILSIIWFCTGRSVKSLITLVIHPGNQMIWCILV